MPLLLALVACQPAPLDGSDARGLLDDGLLNPFPSTHLVVDGRVHVPPHALPDVETELVMGDISWRTGFSPGQTVVVSLPGVDPGTLPSWRDPTPGAGGVRAFDLDTGRPLAVMAELDAWPDAPDPALLVRPMEALPVGHRVAIVVTTDAAPRPDRFDRLVEGDPPEDFAHREAHYTELLDALDGLGVARDDVALAFDFPVGDGAHPLRAALSELALPAWEMVSTADADAGDEVSMLTWRTGRAALTVPDLLVDDEHVVFDADGRPVVQGTTEVEVSVHVPASVRDAAPGTVPVLVVGHGIFGSAEMMLDPGGEYVTTATVLADALGCIAVAADWRGMDDGDRATAAGVAQDFGRLPVLTGRMLQGQVNARALVELVARGDLLEDPLFRDADGEPLADPEHILFHGVSYGAIEGATLLAAGAPIERGALHVGSSTWSSLLERSSIWRPFELLLADDVPEPTDRQRLYALSQLWFDPVDPISWTRELSDVPYLLQINRGDESVSNLGAESLARSTGLPLLAPALRSSTGLEAADGPLPRALVQLDPGLGDPDDGNRPPQPTGAHNATMFWPGVLQQAATFLDEGEVRHFCGDAPCSRMNRGE